MKYDYECDFGAEDIIKKLGLEERGRVQQFVTESVKRLSEPYVPMKHGDLKDSVHIENGTDVVWSTPYAHYQWGGLVWEDPKLKTAGFKVTDEAGAVVGWKSRKYVTKVPTKRPLKYNEGVQDGGKRGPAWVERMLQDGGLTEIRKGIGEIIK